MDVGARSPFSFGLVFFITISTAVIPSFWIYFANTIFQWDGGAPHTLLCSGTIQRVHNSQAP